MRIGRKFRISFIFIFVALIALVSVYEFMGLESGGEAVLVFVVFIAYVIFAFSLKCCNCGRYVYEGLGKNSIGNPYAYLLIKGKCPNCKR